MLSADSLLHGSNAILGLLQFVERLLHGLLLLLHFVCLLLLLKLLQFPIFLFYLALSFSIKLLCVRNERFRFICLYDVGTIDLNLLRRYKIARRRLTLLVFSLGNICRSWFLLFRLIRDLTGIRQDVRLVHLLSLSVRILVQ